MKLLLSITKVQYKNHKFIENQLVHSNHMQHGLCFLTGHAKVKVIPDKDIKISFEKNTEKV